MQKEILEGDVKFVRPSAPEPMRFRSQACADLWIPLVLHRPQASTGPPTLTFYLLPTEFRQHFAWFTFSALTCATQPETPKTTSLWVKPVKPPLHKEALFSTSKHCSFPTDLEVFFLFQNDMNDLS